MVNIRKMVIGDEQIMRLCCAQVKIVLIFFKIKILIMNVESIKLGPQYLIKIIFRDVVSNGVGGTEYAQPMIEGGRGQIMVSGIW